MTEREDLDRKLLKFLDREEDDPIHKRLQRQADWMVEHEAKDDARHVELLRASDSQSWRIATLEQRAQKLEKDIDDSGVHHLESLRAKAKKVDDLIMRIVWLGLSALLAGGIVELIHRVAGK